MGMTSGTTICAKHDAIMDLLRDAKTDGEDMEKKLEERRDEVKELNERIEELENENYDFQKEIDRLEKLIPPPPDAQ